MLDSVNEIPSLAQQARSGVDAATFIATTLERSGLRPTPSSLRALADAGLAGDRFARVLRSGGDALRGLSRPGARSIATCDQRLRARPPFSGGQLGCVLRTIPNIRALLRSQRRLSQISTSTQLSQLTVTKRTFTLLSESLAIQREILVRARSIDRKTGGPAPATPLGPNPGAGR